MAAAVAVSPAVAQTTSVNVPFSFNAAGKTFPAGAYWVSRDDQAESVTLIAKGSPQSFTSLIGPGAANPSENKIALSFDQVGQTHFLQSIQFGTKTTGRLDKKALESERVSAVHSGGR
jgi:hypothetical protein